MSFTASSSFSLRRPVMKTYAPSSTKSLAVASAMPEVAAVMTATFPSSFPITVLLSLWTECLAQAAAGADKLAGDPLGVARSQKGGDAGNVINLADAAERGLRDSAGLEVGADEACGVYAFGLDHAGGDGVDADLLRAKFVGEDASDGVDRALGSGVDRAVGRRQAADGGADVDDAGAFAQVLDGSLRGEQETEDVDVEDLVVVIFCEGFDGQELVDAGVVDQDVEVAEVLDGCVDEALSLSGLGHVAMDGDGFATGGRDGGDHSIGASLG